MGKTALTGYIKQPLLFFSSALHTRLLSLSPKVTNSYIQGPTDTPLLDKTVGQCLEETVGRFADREALVFCRDGVRKTFAQFKEEVSPLFTPQVSG